MRPMFGLLLAFGLLAQPVQAAPGAQTEVATLRAEGPAALARLMALRGQPGIDQGRLRRTIDAVARQKDAHASGLYWHTDIEAAKNAARAQGKPILSLRLLGRLDQAHSCANSRLFRTTLYANTRISAYLRDRYVLHWQSVRPAPRVTIDFGDGRTLTTTLTGNSLHYVLDAAGRPVDALPGLYGAGLFLAELERAERTARALSGLSGAAWRTRRDAHLTREDVAALPARPAGPVSALEAARLTESKAIVELPVLEALLPPEAAPAAGVRPVTPARLRSARLDPGSLALMREHLAGAPDVEGQVARLEAAIARDEALNEAELRPVIAAMLRAAGPDAPLESLTERIYAEVFKTPSSDPYLGLEAAALYNGLERNGLSTP